MPELFNPNKADQDLHHKALLAGSDAQVNRSFPEGKTDRTSSARVEAGTALSLAADLASSGFISASEQAKYGLKVKEVGGLVEAYFHAGGKDIVVASGRVGSQAGQTKINLEQVLQNQIKDVEKTYKVKFASTGEAVERQVTQTTDCGTFQGAMIYAKQPTFADVYAARVALAHSMPSQLSADGRTGVKFYFLDKPFYTQPVYGNKPALAVYDRSDKDNRIAVYVTPDGEKLPVTAKDTANPQARNLSYVLEHELTHNSQQNFSSTDPSFLANLPKSYGWQSTNGSEINSKVPINPYGLKGKNGGSYVNMPTTCGSQTAWLEIRDNKWVAADGKLTGDPEKAAHFTNDQVRANAKVKPVTYYFPNPIEMLSEGLANFRTGQESRRRLFIESPQLYRTAERYDAQEIARVYGVDATGRSKFIRTPEGAVVPRTSASQSALTIFDRSLKFAP